MLKEGATSKVLNFTCYIKRRYHRKRALVKNRCGIIDTPQHLLKYN